MPNPHEKIDTFSDTKSIITLINNNHDFFLKKIIRKEPILVIASTDYEDNEILSVSDEKEWASALYKTTSDKVSFEELKAMTSECNHECLFILGEKTPEFHPELNNQNPFFLPFYFGEKDSAKLYDTIKTFIHCFDENQLRILLKNNLSSVLELDLCKNTQLHPLVDNHDYISEIGYDPDDFYTENRVSMHAMMDSDVIRLSLGFYVHVNMHKADAAYIGFNIQSDLETMTKLFS